MLTVNLIEFVFCSVIVVSYSFDSCACAYNENSCEITIRITTNNAIGPYFAAALHPSLSHVSQLICPFTVHCLKASSSPFAQNRYATLMTFYFFQFFSRFEMKRNKNKCDIKAQWNFWHRGREVEMDFILFLREHPRQEWNGETATKMKVVCDAARAA